VLDSSPLIVLGKLGRLPLLAQMAGTLVVPRAVADEIRRGPAGDPAA
jgi:predicted nucleic acid-binding protein